METTIPTQAAETSAAPTRAQSIWLLAAQIVAIILLAIALWWGPVVDEDGVMTLPSKTYQILLGLLGGGLLLLGIVPAWRRGALTSLLCGLALALACWLSAGKIWELQSFQKDDLVPAVPLIAPFILGAVVALAAWGLITRGGLRSIYGSAALIAGAILATLGITFYVTVLRTPMFNKLYPIGVDQFAQILTIGLLYPPAVWLASLGVRKGSRLSFQPIIFALLIAAALLYWNVILHGGKV